MTDSTITRRDVLRSASAGAVVTVGGGRAVATEETGFGPVRLVEVGLRYDFADDHQYEGAFANGDPVYRVTNDEIVITAPQEKFERVFERNDQVVGTDRVTNVPTAVAGTRPRTGLTTQLRERRLPAAGVSLADPYTPPTVAVRETPKGLVAVAGDRRIDLTPGTREEITLSSETVTARRFRMVDDSPDIEGIPDYQIGPRMETGTVDVTVTPEVVVTDRGELPVRRVK